MKRIEPVCQHCGRVEAVLTVLDDRTRWLCDSCSVLAAIEALPRRPWFLFWPIADAPPRRLEATRYYRDVAVIHDVVDVVCASGVVSLERGKLLMLGIYFSDEELLRRARAMGFVPEGEGWQPGVRRAALVWGEPAEAGKLWQRLPISASDYAAHVFSEAVSYLENLPQLVVDAFQAGFRLCAVEAWAESEVKKQKDWEDVW